MSQHSEGRLILVPSRSNARADGDRAVYTVREVAHLLSLSLGVTYALVRSGEIPARRLGGRWVIPRDRFRQWLDACTVAPDPVSYAPPTSASLGAVSRRDP